MAAMALATTGANRERKARVSHLLNIIYLLLIINFIINLKIDNISLICKL